MANQPSLVLVEYLESTGTQYIDTGYAPLYTNDIEIGGKGYSLQPYVRGGYICNFTPTISSGINIENNSNNKYRFYSGNEIVSIATPQTINEFSLLRKSNGDVIVKLNEEEYSGTSSNVSDGKNFLLYTDHRITTLVANIRLYNAYIKCNDVLVRNLHPALYNGVPCMWDFVENKPHYNQGTGEFLYGKPI